MKIPSLKEQVFGDSLNERLNKNRENLNNEIRQKCMELLKKKREGKSIENKIMV